MWQKIIHRTCRWRTDSRECKLWARHATQTRHVTMTIITSYGENMIVPHHFFGCMYVCIKCHTMSAASPDFAEVWAFVMARGTRTAPLLNPSYRMPNTPISLKGPEVHKFASLAGAPGMFDPARNYTEPTQKRPLNRNYTATSPIEKRHAQQKLQGIGMACAQRGRAGGGGRDRV